MTTYNNSTPASDMDELKKQYEKNNMTVKIYSPAISENHRKKNDVQIRNKIYNIIKNI